MRIVRAPKIGDYFKYNNKWITLSDFYFYNQSIFNKLSLSLFFILVNLILGIFIHACLVIALSGILFLCYAYFKTKKESECVSIRRKIPLYARENETIVVEYSLANASSFLLENFQVSDVFEGTKEILSEIEFNKTLPVRSINIKKKSYTLNMGMGVKSFGPLVVAISDALNIFTFTVVEDNVESIKVYPHIGKIKDMMLRGDKYALHFGMYETQSRGDTTNFIGIRPYRDGDPTNKINWKLSMKTKKLFINEFEKNVNATFAIILNMDERLHMGRGTESTWEYAKDISLSIAARQISNSNTVQFFSNDTFVAAGSGVEHMNFLEMVICTLALSKNTTGNTYLKRAVLNISSEAKVLFITPAFAGEMMEENLGVLKRFSKTNPNIHVAFIDGTLEIAEAIKGNASVGYKGIYLQTQRQLSNNLKDLKDCGIECSVIKVAAKNPYEKAIFNSLNVIQGATFE
jgi:uncharacterized protein (DUF58 family)